MGGLNKWQAFRVQPRGRMQVADNKYCNICPALDLDIVAMKEPDALCRWFKEFIYDDKLEGTDFKLLRCRQCIQTFGEKVYFG